MCQRGQEHVGPQKRTNQTPVDDLEASLAPSSEAWARSIYRGVLGPPEFFFDVFIFQGSVLFFSGVSSKNGVPHKMRNSLKKLAAVAELKLGGPWKGPMMPLGTPWAPLRCRRARSAVYTCTQGGKRDRFFLIPGSFVNSGRWIL